MTQSNQPHIPLYKLDYTEAERDALLHAFSTNTTLFGPNTQKVVEQIQDITGAQFVIPTHSCTVALELALASLGIKAGDEVLVPAHTFMATATAVTAVGATPVIVDIDAKTLCIDVACAERALTEKTRAIMPVHYAGELADMARILSFAKKHNLFVVEDAAHIFGGTLQNGGTLFANKLVGDAQCFSFDQTKHIGVPGKAGALVTNNEALAHEAALRASWGNDFLAFKQGKVSWYDGQIPFGSSSLIQEVHAAVLSVQLSRLEEILKKRRVAWNMLYEKLLPHAQKGHIRLPYTTQTWNHPAHLFYILVSPERRSELIAHAKESGVTFMPHYRPLNLQAAWKNHRFVSKEEVSVAEKTEAQLLRVPCYHLTHEELSRILAVFDSFAW